MGVKISLDGKLYYCAAGIGGVPTWTEVKTTRDATATVSRGEADVTTRGGGGWKAVVGTVKELVVDFEIVAVTSRAVATSVHAGVPPMPAAQ